MAAQRSGHGLSAGSGHRPGTLGDEVIAA
jgi:hypothetical protein